MPWYAAFWPLSEVDQVRPGAELHFLGVPHAAYIEAIDELDEQWAIDADDRLPVVGLVLDVVGTRVRTVERFTRSTRRPNRSAPSTPLDRKEVNKRLAAADLERADVCQPTPRAAPDPERPIKQRDLPPASIDAVEAETRAEILRADPELTAEVREQCVTLCTMARLDRPRLAVACLVTPDSRALAVSEPPASLDAAVKAVQLRANARGSRLVAQWAPLTEHQPKPTARADVDSVRVEQLDTKAGPVSVELGSPTVVFAPGPDGIVALPARYALIPFDAVATSHDPVTFEPRPDYPPHLQERDYRTDRTEQAKVERQSATFRPALVLNSNPDAVNGPPIVDSLGRVLGGNSRAMTIQRVPMLYHVALTDAIAQHCQVFGLRGADLKGRMLVRILDGVDKDGRPIDDRKISALLNRALTQTIGTAAGATSMAAALRPSLLLAIGDALEDEGGLTTAIRSIERTVAAELRSSGLLTAQNQAEWIRSDGRLTDEAIARLRRAIVGALLDDKELFARVEAQRGLFAWAEAVAPWAVALDTLDPTHERGFSVSGALRKAIALGVTLARLSTTDRAPYVLTRSMMPDPALEAVEADTLATAATVWLLHTVRSPVGAGRQIGAYYKAAAAQADASQATLIPDERSPVQMRTEIMGWLTGAQIAELGGPAFALAGQRQRTPNPGGSVEVLAVWPIGKSNDMTMLHESIERYVKPPGYRMKLTNGIAAIAWSELDGECALLPLDASSVAIVRPARRATNPAAAAAFVVPVARFITALSFFGEAAIGREANPGPFSLVTRAAKIVTAVWAAHLAMRDMERVQAARASAAAESADLLTLEDDA